VRELAVRVLRQLGYTVLEASNGMDALRVAGEHSGPIDLLLTDVVMPQLSGNGLAERLQGMYANLKILFMSGYTDSAMLRHGISEATITLLQKPFTADALARKVREMLDQP
jgi:CheY-like chemotaxis protein